MYACMQRTHMYMYACMQCTHNESNKKLMFHHPPAFSMARINSCFVILEILSGKHQPSITRKETAGRQGSPLSCSEQRYSRQHHWVARWDFWVLAQFLTPGVAVSWALGVSGHKWPVEKGGRVLSLVLRGQLLGWSGHPEFFPAAEPLVAVACRPTVHKFLHSQDPAGGTQTSLRHFRPSVAICSMEADARPG